MLDCDKRAEAAKMDQDEMLKLVEEFNPLLVSCARKYQFAPYEDLFSIANVGFITAVKSYSSEKGHFPSYAKLVVTRKLLDESRRMTVSREIACEDETIFLVKSQTESIEKHNVENEARDLKLEVEELKDLISKYEITFERLVKCSPKHKKNRKKCLDIADYICSTQDLHKEVVDKGVLAAKKIGAETGVSTKLIEKYRIYIITQVLIETYDLPMIREFMKG